MTLRAQPCSAYPLDSPLDANPAAGQQCRDVVIALTKAAGWAYARRQQIRRPIVLSTDPAGQRGLTLDDRWRLHVVVPAALTRAMAAKWWQLLLAIDERARFSGYTLATHPGVTFAAEKETPRSTGMPG